MRLVNTTGSTISKLEVSYEVKIFNDQSPRNVSGFEFSINGSGFTEFPALDKISGAGSDITPSFGNTARSIEILSAGILAGDFFFMRWTFEDEDLGVTGDRDEFAIDDIEVTALELTASEPANVPEPGTLAILGLGLVGLGLARRRRTI